MKLSHTLLVVLVNCALSCAKTDDDKNNFVFSGKCVKQPPNFCNELVENSACNNLKDECFCRKGYVAIREGTKISCKTLLTDLVCRMDRDCVHVADSMCHPGAGQCVCPGQHIYVESINACRRKYDDGNNLSCQSCKQNGGQCFEYTRQDMKTYALKSKNNLGCSCNSHRTTTDQIDGLCTTHLVDIGEFCNNKDLLCRSKKAVCSRTSNKESISTCACVTGYVPVYQKTLKYYECFTIISESIFIKCSKCFQSGGYCYDVNGDQEGDGCSCQNRFSNEVDGVSSLQKPCSINHVSVACNNDQMTVCYTAHSRPPYKSLGLQLMNGRAVAIIKSPKHSSKINSARQRLVISTGTYSERFDNNHIRMTSSSSAENENKFCTNIDLTDDRFIDTYQLKNDKVRYSTLIHVIVDSQKSTPGRDMLFPISCLSKPVKKDLSVEKPFSINNNGSADEQPLSLDLRIINPVSNSETSSANHGDLIKLDVSLVDSKSIYREIEVMKCWTTQKRNIKLDYIHNNTRQIIYSKCQEKNNMYNYHSIEWHHSSPGIHYQSSEFIPDLFTNISTIDYHCLILLCRHKTLCTDLDYCGMINTYSRKQKENNQYQIIERQTHLTLVNRSPFIIVTTFQDVLRRECTYSLCLTQTQAVMTTLLMLLLLLLVVILVAILYRRQRAIQHVTLKQKRTCTDPGQHQINTLCNKPCGQKLYLLSDTGSLSTSLDKAESEQCSMYSHLFISNDTYKSSATTRTTFQDNFPNSFCQQVSPGEVYSVNNHHGNNNVRKSVLLKNIPHSFNNDVIDRMESGQGPPDVAQMQMDSYVNYASDTLKMPRKATIDKLTLIDNASTNEVRNSVRNSSNKDVYV